MCGMLCSVVDTRNGAVQIQNNYSSHNSSSKCIKPKTNNRLSIICANDDDDDDDRERDDVKIDTEITLHNGLIPKRFNWFGRLDS